MGSRMLGRRILARLERYFRGVCLCLGLTAVAAPAWAGAASAAVADAWAGAPVFFDAASDAAASSVASAATPPPDNNLWQAARAMAQKGDYEKAAALYASAYEQNSSSVLYRQYFEVLLKLSRYKEAEALALRQMKLASKAGGRAGTLPQSRARCRVDLGQIYALQGSASKAHKTFLQAVEDYWEASGAGVGLEELSTALWAQSGTARYSAALYEEARKRSTLGAAAFDNASTPYAYELFKAYLHLGQMDRMLEEALNFVQGQGGAVYASATSSGASYAAAQSEEEKDPYRAAIEQVESDWQTYLYGAAPNANASPSGTNASPNVNVNAASGAASPAGGSAFISASPKAKTASAGPNGSATMVNGKGFESLATAPQGAASSLKKSLHAYLQKHPQDLVAAEWIWWAALQEGDYGQALRMAAVFRNFDPSDGGQKTLQTIRLAVENQKDAVAVEAMEKLLSEAEKNVQAYRSDVVRLVRREWLDLQFRRLEKGQLRERAEILRLKEAYLKLWNASPHAASDPEMWPVARNLSRLYAYHLHEEEAAGALLETCIAQGRVSALRKAEMKTEYADMLLFMGKTWDAMLLYAQVEKDFKQDAVGFYAKLQTARLSYYVGEFEWALSQLEVLRAATSKLIANDAMELSLLIKENMGEDSTYRGLRYVARADALTYRRLYAEALQTLDSVLLMPSEAQLHDDVYYKKAQIYGLMDSVPAALEALEKVYRWGSGSAYGGSGSAGANGLTYGSAAGPTGAANNANSGSWNAAAYGQAQTSLYADDALLQASLYYENMNQTEKAMALCRELFERFPSSLLASRAIERYRALRQQSGFKPSFGGN